MSKKTNKDKFYVYSSFKQFFAYSRVSSALAVYCLVLKCHNSSFSDQEMLGFVN